MTHGRNTKYSNEGLNAAKGNRLSSQAYFNALTEVND